MRQPTLIKKKEMASRKKKSGIRIAYKDKLNKEAREWGVKGMKIIQISVSAEHPHKYHKSAIIY
jgi:hypothetical protein